MSGDMPMPPDRFQQLIRARELAPPPDPLIAVEPRLPATETTPLATELLGEAGDRPLESGELLLLCEEATLADLEAAAGGARPAADPPDSPADDPVMAALAAPRLYSSRLDQIMAWQPPLAEILRLLEAALQTDQTVTTAMLVGHVETYPERVEHLMRLRHLVDQGRGRVVLRVELAQLDGLPSRDRRVRRVAEAARPTDAGLERRHALALARLALGPDAVSAA